MTRRLQEKKVCKKKEEIRSKRGPCQAEIINVKDSANSKLINHFMGKKDSIYRAICVTHKFKHLVNSILVTIRCYEGEKHANKSTGENICVKFSITELMTTGETIWNRKNQCKQKISAALV